MIKHKYLKKEEMQKEEKNENKQYEWVLHVKPQKIKKYGRFFKP